MWFLKTVFLRENVSMMKVMNGWREEWLDQSVVCE